MQPEEAPANILLVDDDPRNLLALEAVLGGAGWNLVRAGSGEEALKRLLQQEFAVIVLDVQMPGMDGFETAALIRDREKLRGTPIIFLTAANRSEMFVAKGYAVGAVDYMLKPFNPEILRSKVAVFVDLFRKTEEVKQQAATNARLEGVLLTARTFEHELNTKLTTTIGYAEMLARDPALPPHLQRRAAQCLEGAQEASRIIRHLLHLTKIEVTDWGKYGTTISLHSTPDEAEVPAAEDPDAQPPAAMDTPLEDDR